MEKYYFLESPFKLSQLLVLDLVFQDQYPRDFRCTRSLVRFQTAYRETITPASDQKALNRARQFRFAAVCVILHIR